MSSMTKQLFMLLAVFALLSGNGLVLAAQAADSQSQSVLLLAQHESATEKAESVSNNEEGGRDLADGYEAGMFALYADNRRNGIPNLVTPDLLLLAYSQIRLQQIVALENDVTGPAFEQLITRLDSQLSAAEPGAVSEFNRNFIGLLASLWTDSSAEKLTDEAQQERQLIQAATEVTASPLWGITMDYTQFKPRGRYSKTPQDQRYFRTMRYANSALFGFQASAATGLTESRAGFNALLARDLVSRLATAEVAPQYADLDQRLAWQFGDADDLTVQDVTRVFATGQSDADSPDQSGAASQMANQLVEYAVNNHRLPRIVGGVVDVNRLSPGQSVAQALTGWRFLPARYSADNGALQQLVYTGGDALELRCELCDRPPENSGVVNGRRIKAFPSYLEVMALLGSEVAADRLDNHNMRSYSSYAERSRQAAELLHSAKGLEKSHVQLIKALLADTPDAGAGSLISDDASLAAASGFWVWQKYTNLLYQKQPYTLQGRGLQLNAEQPREGAWLAGSPGFYQALADLVKEHQIHSPGEAWDGLSEIVTACLQISRTIANNSAPDNTENDFLNNIDTALQALGAGNDQPVIVDVHTSLPDKKVLEVGTGYPLVEQYRQSRGAVFNVIEFSVDIERRLTVEQWRAVLSSLKRKKSQ